MFYLPCQFVGNMTTRHFGLPRSPPTTDAERQVQGSTAHFDRSEERLLVHLCLRHVHALIEVVASDVHALPAWSQLPCSCDSCLQVARLNKGCNGVPAIDYHALNVIAVVDGT